MSMSRILLKEQTTKSDDIIYGNCILLKNLTPNRRASHSIYLCRCRICGNEFIRSKKSITMYSDCGCITNKNTNNHRINDRTLRKLDPLSKSILKMKIDAMKKPTLSHVFKVLYIDNNPVNEYVAINNYMSLSTLHRYRRQIFSLWSLLKNDIMEENINVYNKSN